VYFAVEVGKFLIEGLPSLKNLRRQGTHLVEEFLQFVALSANLLEEPLMLLL
jgi:hypothetical protein